MVGQARGERLGQHCCHVLEPCLVICYLSRFDIDRVSLSASIVTCGHLRSVTSVACHDKVAFDISKICFVMEC